MARSDKRSRLVAAATALVHEQGFARTTLADIAHRAEVPPGNVYYYFRSKEEIGRALVERHLDGYRARREQWDADLTPRARVAAFIDMTVADRELLARSGCPVGTLCAELHKQGGPLADSAAQIFAELLGWLEDQFAALGHRDDTGRYAAHVLAALQGAALLAQTFGSPDYVTREARQLKEWVESL